MEPSKITVIISATSQTLIPTKLAIIDDRDY